MGSYFGHVPKRGTVVRIHIVRVVVDDVGIDIAVAVTEIIVG